MGPTLLIGDIVEREAGANKPVEFPAPPSSSTGFPQHKRRWKTSALKQPSGDRTAESRGGAERPLPPPPPPPSGSCASQQQSFQEAERTRIDQENRQKIASMSPQEIAQAQDDIINGLHPALVQRLLRRATIDNQSEASPFNAASHEPHKTAPSPPDIKVEHAPVAPTTSSTPTATATTDASASAKQKTDGYDEEEAPAQLPPDLFPITDQPKSTHFPVPPSLPDLDPSDPDFLATLHEKYFPNLPADPSKLAWMAPVPSKDSPADRESPYYPHPEIGISALRFDFRGRFLSPRVSRSIPSTKGLHHHGEAPEAAGYTIAELARLARSAVPAQRCMAYQTLGRILYRLGQGEWGKTEDDAIAMGVWSSVKQGRVLESLLEAASGDGGHRGSRAYATEALWLFEKGGWKEAFKGR